MDFKLSNEALSTKPMDEEQAQEWARRLRMRIAQVMAAYPNADPDNVRHTLILLEQPPLERLQRSLIRGRTLRGVAHASSP